MNDATLIVFVINDEDTVRRALRRVIRPGGFCAEAFALARELLLCGLVTGRAAL
jgi:FixJ family two-component response regulator